MDPIYTPLVDYGLLGIFLVIVISALGFTARFIVLTFKDRVREFREREEKYENKIDKLSERLDDYIDNDHKALVQALDNHSDAYKSQAQTNRLLFEKLMSHL